jgi:hypothetical protein
MIKLEPAGADLSLATEVDHDLPAVALDLVCCKASTKVNSAKKPFLVKDKKRLNLTLSFPK